MPRRALLAAALVLLTSALAPPLLGNGDGYSVVQAVPPAVPYEGGTPAPPVQPGELCIIVGGVESCGPVGPGL